MKKLLLIAAFLLSLTNLKLLDPVGVDAVITPFLIIAFPMAIYYFAHGIRMRSARSDYGPWLISAYIFFVSLMHYQDARWSSVALFMVYLGFFGFVRGRTFLIERRDIEKLSKLIITVYFVNVISALLVFKVSGSHLAPWLFQVYDQGVRLRYQGFSSEPSYASFVVCISLFAYLNLNAESSRKNIFWIILVAILMVFFQSVYGYILFVACVSIFISRGSSARYLKLVFIVIGGLSVTLLLLSLDLLYEPDNSRLIGIFHTIYSTGFNLDSLHNEDSSAYMRVGPSFSYIFSPQFYSVNGVFGYGPGSARHFFGTEFSDVIAQGQRGYEEGVISLGLLPSFLYEYGIVGFGLMAWLIVRRSIGRLATLSGFLVLLASFNANLNTQMFCFTVIMLCFSSKISARKLDHEA